MSAKSRASAILVPPEGRARRGLFFVGILREPLLYLSLYFKQNRARYYELLDRVRREGDWET